MQAQYRLPAPLAGNEKGEAAIVALGSKLDLVAQGHGLNGAELGRLLRTQKGLGVDRVGSLMFACDALPVVLQNSAALQAAGTGGSSETLAAQQTGDALHLHSLPGANRVIYLDFDGHTTSGTQWNSSYTGGGAINSAPFDLDGSPNTFNGTEQAVIRGIWQRVAEDYAPFAVDVTTEDPGVDALRKSNSGDNNFGIRVVISPTNWYNQAAGGVAYVGSFNWNSDTPCFIFSGQLASAERYIAEAASHETGHTLGLYHDGRTGSSATDYYSGHGDWAPIMGIGYYASVTQFSKGEYSDANNNQDDLAVISTYLPYATDDHGNSMGNATTLSGPTVSNGGTIESSSDVDFFKFTTGSGLVTLAIQSPSPSPNLDVKAELLNSSGQVIQTSDPLGLSASISATLSAGTYYLKISGVGYGNPANTGYSAYGSIGNYVITGTLGGTSGNQAPTAVVSASTTGGSVPLTVSFTGSNSYDTDGGIVSYSWNFGDGGTSYSTNPTYVYTSAGQFTATLTVTDNGGLTHSASVGISVSSASGIVPAFTQHPASQEIPFGSTATFSAAASGSPAPSFQWYKNGSVIAGANSATFTIPSVSFSDSNSIFHATATNSAGTAVSNSAVLWVSAAFTPNVAPSIVTQPQSQSVSSGATVTFSVNASGTPAPSFQWFRNGNAVVGGTAATLTLSNVTFSDSGAIFAVSATNSAGSVTSNPVTLTVVGSGNIAPSFTLHPYSQEVSAGAIATFVVAATGSPAPTFQWYRNGTPIVGATNDSFTLISVSLSDSNTSFNVIATNAAGSATSGSAALWVRAGTSGNVAPTITSQPGSQSVSVGANATFTVAASGSPAPTYQWYKNGSPISGATNTTLTLYSVTTADSGALISAIASNGAGSASTGNAILTVTSTGVAPAFTLHPWSQEISAGTTATFVVATTGSPTPAIQWYRNGAPIAGATNATLLLPSVSLQDSNSLFNAVATNSAGSATSNPAVLWVKPATGNIAPSITTQPTNQAVPSGGSISFSVAASGSPSPTYQWYKNGSHISGATSATLTLYSVTAADSGALFYAIATNAAGSATSSTATLTVSSTGVAPVFTLNPWSQEIPLGSTAIFNVAATGAQSYQWYRNGVPISGATSSTLSLSSVQFSDSNTLFHATATNSAGTTTSAPAVLWVSNR